MSAPSDYGGLHGHSYQGRWHCHRSRGGLPCSTDRRAGVLPGRRPTLSPVLPLHGWRTWWLWLAMLTIANLPCEAWASTYKVAIVGPWSCDPLFAKALPDLAARLATSRINKDSSINKGYWYDYVLVSEECQTSEALARFAELEGHGSAFLGPTNPGYCSSAAMFGKNWNKAVLSWSCLDPDMDRVMYPTFLQPMPLSARVLFAVLRFFRWPHVAIVTSPGDLWRATGHELAMSLRALGVPVRTVVTMETDEDGAHRALQVVRDTHKVQAIIMCMHSALIGGEDQRQLLSTAVDMQMIGRGYVFFSYDTLLYSLPYKDTVYPILANDTKLSRAYDAVLTVTMDSGERTFYEAFEDAQRTREIRTSVPPQQVSPFFGTIYNGLYYIAKAVEQTRQAGGRWVTGTALARSEGGFEFQGFNQPLSAGVNGEGMQARFVVLDTDGRRPLLWATHKLEAPHTYGTLGGLKYLGRSIHFPGMSVGSWFSTESSCWFNPSVACSGGMDGFTLFLMFTLACILIVGGAALAYVCRGKLNRVMPMFGGSTSKLILSLDDLVFINTQFSRKKLNEESIIKSMLDVKTPFRSVSGRSYIHTTPEDSNIALYEGDWVWLKKCPNGETVTSINESTKSIFNKLRDMRHENLNLYLGLFLDSGIFAIVTEHCTRGSLEDLLSNCEMRLDWMFKSSLLMDLIRGMKYLHNRKIIHARLKSRNCVVDGRFVLKVTEYGFNGIMDAQNMVTPESKPEDLLWTAPELLRKLGAERKGTFPGDVYSFSIVMQEIISRSAPFCMLDMPAHEIIEKVRSPPPLCRPSVSVDEAPLECIQIMKQCWSEEPEMRPTFEDIFIQFKNMNKGKKTNIIDSMLRMLEQYSSNLEDLIRERTEELEVERQKTDKLLAQMLPRSVAHALKTGKPVQPEHFPDVTLYFSDIVGFTTISALSEPIEVVDLLNDLYTLFDAIIGEHDVYKVETIGDAYMVASGVPNRNGNRHAAEVANMSLDILHCIGAFKMRHMPDVKVRIRIGLHSGTVVAGVVGLTMPRYCLFGDTVNTASRMESTGLPYRIHVNQSTVDILRSLKLGYKMEPRGRIELKGKGMEQTFWLVGRDGFNKPLPIPPDLSGTGSSSHGISLDEIPADRRQMFLERQKRMGF